MNNLFVLIQGMLATNIWLFNVLGDEELFEDGYFFNLSDGDILEVNLDSSMGTAESNLDYVSSQRGSVESFERGNQTKVSFI